MSEMTFTILDANRAIFSRRHDSFWTLWWPRSVPSRRRSKNWQPP